MWARGGADTVLLGFAGDLALHAQAARSGMRDSHDVVMRNGIIWELRRAGYVFFDSVQLSGSINIVA